MKKSIAVVALIFGMTSMLAGQTAFNGSLDPARDASKLHRPQHTSLPEQYIWTANDAAVLRADHAKFSFRDRERKIDPHAFRTSFNLNRIPAAATLYIAGPRHAKAYLNGKLVMDETADANSPLATHVLRADAHSALRIGRNLLAIEAVRGRGIVAASDSPVIQQLAYGETLVAKIVPATAGIDTPALTMTNAGWRSSLNAPEGWEQPEFDDSSWPRVQTLGAIESHPEFFQWNLDAGLYDWPGYLGMSPYLRTYSLTASAITHRINGTGTLLHTQALTNSALHQKFSVHLPAKAVAANDAPSLLLDFGREVAGRLLISSNCDCEAQVLVSYGESESEALSGKNYLGTNLLRIPPHGTARGPKSGLRYAFLRFAGGASQTEFRSIRLEGIVYPVTYKGSFESSDPLLNHIWETSAQTAHLCMQDGIWDAPKRDRGWWVGDLDISGPVIGDVFADHFLLDETLTRLTPQAGQHVNGIPSYTALWITTLADLYRHSGDKTALGKHHAALLQLLSTMDAEFDDSGHFLNKNHRWLFVDWSPELFAFTDQADEGTELEFVRGYREGTWLLSELSDKAAADKYQARADALAAQARKQFAENSGAYGNRWQLNAMAVLADVATERNYSSIWNQSLRNIGADKTQLQSISPYFNDYLLQAMARMGHRREALDWMREYWGGMLDEGATSFWEAYDLRWPKNDPHQSLQADGVTGYFVSLAHGWSSGPASWMMEEMLGIHAVDAGFRETIIRPDLLGLDWIKGQLPTPQGPICVAMRSGKNVEITLPPAVEATVLVPLSHKGVTVLVNGERVAFTPAENGTRAAIVLRKPGRYSITSK